MKTDFIDISLLNVREPFVSIFPIGEETLASITQNMEANGFDEVFPIIVWEDKNIVVDGHTRFTAAKELGMEQVPVMYKEFANEDDAILYSFHIQRNRRNMSDDDILKCLALLDNIHKNNPKQNDPKPTRKNANEQRAKELGISPGKVDKARKVLEYGDEKIKDSVHSGEKSINKAFQEIQEIRRESGEIKGTPTTGLGAATRYTQALGKFLKELTRIREEGWQDVSREKALSDIDSVRELIEG